MERNRARYRNLTDDNRVFVAAVEAEADCIVSGDPHLLDLGPYRGIEIIAPVRFVKMIER